jgi:hypothetical protein
LSYYPGWIIIKKALSLGWTQPTDLGWTVIKETEGFGQRLTDAAWEIIKGAVRFWLAPSHRSKAGINDMGTRLVLAVISSQTQ